MDPKDLIDTSYLPALPAPLWFIDLFKILGYTLHAVPMNLWYAGTILAVILYARGGEHARRLAGRLMLQLPLLIAYGINFGIVPLLFIQVAYAKVFYPATILMAWPWFSIVVLLTLAYYGVYLYQSGVKDAAQPLAWWKAAAGWVAAICFIAIGFTFASGISLMADVAAWPALWMKHSVSGAATGVGHHVGDPSLWPRWLMMFGLALTTTGAWAYVDAAWFAGKEAADYRRWAANFARNTYTIGTGWVLITGSWYVFGTWRSEVFWEMFSLKLILLTLVTAGATLLPCFLLWRDRQTGDEPARSMGLLLAGLQYGVIGINAISRHIVQRLELAPYFDPSVYPVETQLGPLLIFLGLFVAGLGLIYWMVLQVVKVHRAERSNRKAV